MLKRLKKRLLRKWIGQMIWDRRNPELVQLIWDLSKQIYWEENANTRYALLEECLGNAYRRERIN